MTINSIAANIGEWRRGKGFHTPAGISGTKLDVAYLAEEISASLLGTRTTDQTIGTVTRIIARHLDESKSVIASEAEVMLGKLMLVVTELAEAAEAARKGNLENFNEEIADTFIRAMDITDAAGIDIDSEIAKKMAVNQNRPWRHGTQVAL